MNPSLVLCAVRDRPQAHPNSNQDEELVDGWLDILFFCLGGGLFRPRQMEGVTTVPFDDLLAQST